METVLRVLAPVWVVGWVAYSHWAAVRLAQTDNGDPIPLRIGDYAAGFGMGAITYGMISLLVGGAIVLCGKLLLWSFTGSQYIGA